MGGTIVAKQCSSAPFPAARSPRTGVSEEGVRLGDPGARAVSVSCCGSATKRIIMTLMQERYGMALRRWRLSGAGNA